MHIDNPMALEILHRSKVARIATVSRNGRPSVNPLYFINQDGIIWLGTASWTLAARNVQANPQVSLLVELERGENDRRILRLTGKARVRDDAETVRAYGYRVVRKYVLTIGWIRNALAHFRLLPLQQIYRAQSKQKGKTCVIEFSPEQVELFSNGHQPC